jgi:hypothetical protein
MCVEYDRLAFGRDYVGLPPTPGAGEPPTQPYQALEDCLQQDAAVESGLYVDPDEGALGVTLKCRPQIIAYVHETPSFVAGTSDAKAGVVTQRVLDEARQIVLKRRVVCHTVRDRPY